jgi:hypothetical protein
MNESEHEGLRLAWWNVRHAADRLGVMGEAHEVAFPPKLELERILLTAIEDFNTVRNHIAAQPERNAALTQLRMQVAAARRRASAHCRCRHGSAGRHQVSSALHLLWRAMRSSGEAPGVYMQQGDLPGSVLTPDEARTLSKELLSAADDAERGRITALTRAWYHGCWDAPGHYLHHVGGSAVHRDDVSCPLRSWIGLDGGFAPKTRGGDVFFACMYADNEDRRRAVNANAELPQGHFLIHRISGVTLMAWWDRTHGDKRGACNSVYAVEGDFGADQMLEWWPRHFPLQAKHMETAGVKLVQVRVGAFA